MAALIVGVGSLIMIGVVVFLAVGPGGSMATSGAATPPAAQSGQGSAGAPLALVPVVVLALGAVAIAATLAMSRARAMAARSLGSVSPNRGGVPSTPPERGGPRRE